MNQKEILLLKHQYELIADTSTKILGLCSGFGAGKTYAVARKAVHLATLNPGVDGIITEPNYPLLTQILIPEMEAALDDFGLQYRFSKSDSIFYVQIAGLETRIICKSMERYDRLIGINAAWVIMDEFDTAKEELAYNAYLKLLGRMRRGSVRQMVIVSTPEGFRAFYKIFIKDAQDGKRLIKAKTMDNKHLPEDYIDTMRQTYPSNLINAYLDGEFVNLTSGTVYVKFDRQLNHSSREWDGREKLHIGMDFNVGRMCAVSHVIDGDRPIAVDEITGGYDTPEMIQTIKRRYWKEVSDGNFQKTCEIVVYPDASGKNRKSVGASETDISLLKQAGFQVLAKNANPAVRDRINATNAMFCNANGERRYLVNTHKCSKYTEKLEQQVYKDNGEPEKDGTEDINDAGSYFIAYKYPIHKPITHIPLTNMV